MVILEIILLKPDLLPFLGVYSFQIHPLWSIVNIGIFSLEYVYSHKILIL